MSEQMVERRRNWTNAETSALLVIWSDKTIQRQLLGTTRNTVVFRTIFERLQQRGYLGQEAICQEKIKALKKKYKEVTDRFCQSGVGIKLDDEPNDYEVYVGFKWLAELCAVLWTRAIVSPPALLDIS